MTLLLLNYTYLDHQINKQAQLSQKILPELQLNDDEDQTFAA